MAHKYLFVGGPWDGKRVYVSDGLDYVDVDGFLLARPYRYEAKRYMQQRDMMYREVTIFSGGRLSNSVQAAREIQDVPWQLMPEPSLLKEPREWFRWALTKHGVFSWRHGVTFLGENHGFLQAS